MTREQKLDAIVRKIDELLEIASKRTPGEWEAFQRNEEIGTNYCRITFTDRNSDSLHGYCGEHNATYIAKSAGPDEAGWIATKAAIEGLAKDRMLETQGKRAAIDGIIAAWEAFL